MNTIAVPLLSLASGWGWSAFLLAKRDTMYRLVGAVSCAVVVTGGWLGILDVCGIPWGPVAVGAGWLPGLILALAAALRGASRFSWRQHLSRVTELASWAAAVAFVGVVLRAAAVAVVPAFGWDFRYIWGLKARVFALAGAHDFVWLALPLHGFCHPDYPLLWPDLVATGIINGAASGAAASIWGSLLIVGLGVACWWLARPAGRPLAALAALAGAWFPTLFACNISYSGSAEPLAAFLFAAALVAVPTQEREADFPPLLAVALVGLALTKQEGTILALLTAVTVLPRLTRGARLILLTSVAASILVWQLPVIVAGVPRRVMELNPARMISRAVALPGGLVEALSLQLVLETVLLVVILTAPRTRGVRWLKLTLALWIAAVVVTLIVLSPSLPWLLHTAFVRVIVIPLPGALALVLGAQPCVGDTGVGTRAVGRGEGVEQTRDGSRRWNEGVGKAYC